MAIPLISVVIPLYNKAAEIGKTLRSVLEQTFPPLEIIVVDDGSTDRGAEYVQQISSPLVRLIRQPNGGVCRARNRGIEAARGEYIALLDADDVWHPRFLEEIASMIGEFPGCGLYSTRFNILSHDGLHPAPAPFRRGIVPNFFRESAHRYIVIPSTACIPRRVLDDVGGFPDGMKIGEDLYMWIKIARKYRVCFSPEALCDYSRVASNRSASIYTPEQTTFSFEALYDPDAPEEQNEFVARAALGKALIVCTRGGTQQARRAVEFFAYTKVYRRTWRKVKWLCRIPSAWRPCIMGWYNALAWKIARKGL